MNKNELIDRCIFRVWKDDENDFIAACAEFPSMSGFGPTRSADLDALQDALDTAIQWMEEDDEDIPVPHQEAVGFGPCRKIFDDFCLMQGGKTGA